MIREADYQNLARTLVQIYGEGALSYVRRNAKRLRLESGDSEQVEAWSRVAGMVERLVSTKARHRRNDDAAPAV